MSSLQHLFKSLEDRSWAVCDTSVLAGWQETLYQESQRLWQDNRFHPAHIGRHENNTANTDIRGDAICWLDTNANDTLKHPFFAWVDQFRQALNERYYLGLRSEEFHFARYPAGTGYKKHMDQHRSSQRRKISIVLYLNSDWGVLDGGELCIYSPKDDTAELARVLPQPARLVVFRSDLIPHEVLLSQKTRWSLSGWLRTDMA